MTDLGTPPNDEHVPWLTRPLIRVLLVLVGVFVVMQLVPIRVENPPVSAEPNWDAPRTRELAVAACFDCHSNQTDTYFFEKIAPVSWWIKGHVDEGRDALNYSECGTSREESDEQAETVREGSMPPSYYTWFGLHKDAKLSKADRDALAAGLIATATRGCG